MKRWLGEPPTSYDASPRQRRNDIIVLLVVAALAGLVGALFKLA